MDACVLLTRLSRHTAAHLVLTRLSQPLCNAGLALIRGERKRIMTMACGGRCKTLAGSEARPRPTGRCLETGRAKQREAPL